MQKNKPYVYVYVIPKISERAWAYYSAKCQMSIVSEFLRPLPNGSYTDRDKYNSSALKYNNTGCGLLSATNASKHFLIG